MSSRTVIGDFRSPAGNAPRKAEAPAPPPPVEAPEEIPETSTKQDESADAAADVAEIPLTPAERYRKRLEDNNISIKEAASIFDSVMSKEFYEEYVYVRGQRAVFRTRVYEDQLRMQTALETIGPKLQVTQDELIGRYNLAASLYEWKGKAIKHETEEDFDRAMSMIRRMPGPLVSLLMDALAKFDTKMMLVFSEGATDSF